MQSADLFELSFTKDLWGDPAVAIAIGEIFRELRPAHCLQAKRGGIRGLLKKHLDAPLQSFLLRQFPRAAPGAPAISTWGTSGSLSIDRALRKLGWPLDFEHARSPHVAKTTLNAVIELGNLLDLRTAKRTRRDELGSEGSPYKLRSELPVLLPYETCEHCPEYTQRYINAIGPPGKWEEMPVLLHRRVRHDLLVPGSHRFCSQGAQSRSAHAGGKVAADRFAAWLKDARLPSEERSLRRGNRNDLINLLRQHGVGDTWAATRRTAHFLARPQTAGREVGRYADALDAHIDHQRKFADEILRAGRVHQELFPLYTDRSTNIQVSYRNRANGGSGGIVGEHKTPVRLPGVSLEDGDRLIQRVRSLFALGERADICFEIRDLGLYVELNRVAFECPHDPDGFGLIDSGKRGVARVLLTMNFERGFQYRWVVDHLRQLRPSAATKGVLRAADDFAHDKGT